MKLLMIGGTMFLGRHVVAAALDAGHEVTLFNRGRTNPGLYPDVETITGDRRESSSLEALGGRTWDAVVDTCGYFPRDVRATAGLLTDATEHYTFVSSLSVYADFSTAGADESYPLAILPEGTDPDSVDQITGETYGPLKALCEEAAEAAMPGRVANVRAGLIVGPHDPTDRFTYWVVRASRGGRMLAPAEPSRIVSWVDGRDLGSWIVRLAADRLPGSFNATSSPGLYTMGSLVDACVAETGAGAEPVWVSPEFLAAHEVAPWSDVPVWVPDDEEGAGLHDVNVDRATAAGLTFRSVAETVRDTWAWAREWPPDRTLRAGLAPERETELLEAWSARTSA